MNEIVRRLTEAVRRSLELAHEDRALATLDQKLLHAPRPGPLYWDWRCMVCDRPVANHPSWCQRFRARLIDGSRGDDA